MRSANISVSIVLFVSSLLLATGNLWVTAARSTIPLTIDAQLNGKEIRREKHPGMDDVLLITLSDGRTLQVDAPIYVELQEGEQLSKSFGQRSLLHNDEHLTLEWSADVQGMMWNMPLALALCFVLSVVPALRQLFFSSR